MEAQLTVLIAEGHKEAPRAARAVPEEPYEGTEHREECRGEPLEAPRRPDPEKTAHQDRQVPSGEGEEVALLHIIDAAEPGAPRATRVAHVGEAALRALGAQALKAAALVPAHPPAICVERIPPSRGLVLPATRPTLRPLWDVSAQIVGRAFRHRLRLVVALVGNDLGGEGVASRAGDVFLRLADTLKQSLAVGLIGWIDRRRDHNLALEVDDVLGLVGQMRAAVLHLGDAALGIGGGFPVFVGNPLLPLAI